LKRHCAASGPGPYQIQARDRRLPCHRRRGGRHRLGSDRPALPAAGPAGPVPGGGAEPGRRGGDGGRPGGRTRASGSAGSLARLAGLSSATRYPRGPAPAASGAPLKRPPAAGRPWNLRAATPSAATSASGLLLAPATLRPLEHDQRGCDDDQQYARYHVVDHAACLSISPRVATHPAAAAAGAGRASDRNHARRADLAVAFALISVESPPCDPTATSGAGSGLAGCFWHSFHSWPLLQLHPLRRKHITLSS